MNAHDTMAAYVAHRAPHLAPRHSAEIPAPIPTRRAPRRGFSGRQLAGIALAGALIGAWLSPGRAYADPIPGGARDVVALDRGPAGPRIAVTLSNGHRDILRPCRYEDGRHCYWRADFRGNGRGRSMIITRGRVHYIPTAALAAVTR